MALVLRLVLQKNIDFTRFSLLFGTSGTRNKTKTITQKK